MKLQLARSGDSFVSPDPRRTAASQMTTIGISRLVVSKILNHAEPGVTAVYDRHSYDAEKRAALAKVGRPARGNHRSAHRAWLRRAAAQRRADPG
jgi:hypothetical protein